MNEQAEQNITRAKTVRDVVLRTIGLYEFEAFP